MWAKARAVGNAQRCPRAAPVRASASSTCPQPCPPARPEPPQPVRACARPEQRLAGLVEFLGGLHIGQCPRQLLQFQQRDAGRRKLAAPGRLASLSSGVIASAGPVHALDAPGLLGVGQLGGKQAGPVEVQERVEVLAAVGVEASGMAAVDVLVAELLAHHGPVLGLGQAVVVAVPRAAARELDAQLVEQSGHLVVDVLAAVVGMKAQDLERELRQHLLDHAEQVRLGDRLHAGHHLPLGDAVHGVDVVQPLDAVQVALVHAVDADEAGPALGRRRLAHADLGVLASAGSWSAPHAGCGSRRCGAGCTGGPPRSSPAARIARHRRRRAGGATRRPWPGPTACPWRGPHRPAAPRRRACTGGQTGDAARRSS